MSIPPDNEQRLLVSNPENKEQMQSEIRKFWFHEMPDKLEGISVVVDACAASVNMAILLSKSPQRLVVVNKENLQRARGIYVDIMFLGETEDEELSGLFDVDNRPQNIVQAEVAGRNLVWMSINGSRVMEGVMQRTNGEIIVGSFQNFSAVVSYLRERGEAVNLIMAGDRGTEVPGDRLSAEVIEKKLLGIDEEIDWASMRDEALSYFAENYPLDIQELLYIFDYPDEFAIVPKCIINDQGLLEVVDAQKALGMI